jgi:hypothetical protein
LREDVERVEEVLVDDSERPFVEEEPEALLLEGEVARVLVERVLFVVREVVAGSVVPRDSTVERVGVVPRVSAEEREVEEPRDSVSVRVAEVPRLSDEDLSRVVAVPLSEPEVRVELSVVDPSRLPPVVRPEGVALLELWLLLTCVPVLGLWSRVCSGTLTEGRLVPGVQEPLGMGAGAVGGLM